MLIYRGVSKSLDDSNGGAVKPKGYREELEGECGDTKIQCGDKGVSFGTSEGNATYLHNLCSVEYPTSFVSFTSDELVAQHFATSGNVEDGWVYVTHIDLLVSAGIKFSRGSSEAINNHESEVLVNLNGLTHLPESVVLKKYLQKPNA